MCDNINFRDYDISVDSNNYDLDTNTNLPTIIFKDKETRDVAFTFRSKNYNPIGQGTFGSVFIYKDDIDTNKEIIVKMFKNIPLESKQDLFDYEKGSIEKFTDGALCSTATAESSDENIENYSRLMDAVAVEYEGRGCCVIMHKGEKYDIKNIILKRDNNLTLLLKTIIGTQHCLANHNLGYSDFNYDMFVACKSKPTMIDYGGICFIDKWLENPKRRLVVGSPSLVQSIKDPNNIYVRDDTNTIPGRINLIDGLSVSEQQSHAQSVFNGRIYQFLFNTLLLFIMDIFLKSIKIGEIGIKEQLGHGMPLAVNLSPKDIREYGNNVQYGNPLQYHNTRKYELILINRKNAILVNIGKILDRFNGNLLILKIKEYINASDAYSVVPSDTTKCEIKTQENYIIKITELFDSLNNTATKSESSESQVSTRVLGTRGDNIIVTFNAEYDCIEKKPNFISRQSRIVNAYDTLENLYCTWLNYKLYKNSSIYVNIWGIQDGYRAPAFNPPHGFKPRKFYINSPQQGADIGTILQYKKNNTSLKNTFLYISNVEKIFHNESKSEAVKVTFVKQNGNTQDIIMQPKDHPGGRMVGGSYKKSKRAKRTIRYKKKRSTKIKNKKIKTKKKQKKRTRKL